MKKYLLLLLLLLPFSVFAENTIIQNAPYTIKARVNLEGKEIEAGEFTFELRDEKGNVIDTSSNDKDGVVTFKTMKNNFEILSNSYRYKMSYSPSNVYGSSSNYETPESNMIIYTINMVRNKNDNYKLDYDTAYVGVATGIHYEGEYPIEVNYLKNPESLNVKEEFGGKEHYYAKPSELQGVAYGEYDFQTRTYTVFRDEPGKYSTGDTVGSKLYHANIEDYFVYNSAINNSAKKIVIKDPIKPASSVYMYYLFGQKPYLEEIEGIEKVDTSNGPNMSQCFNNDVSLKKLDLSTWDTSKTTDFTDMFYNAASLEEIILGDFDTSGVTYFSNLHNMFKGTTSLKKINLDSFDFLGVMPDYWFQYSGVESLDFSNANMPDSDQTFFNYMIHNANNLRYINFPYTGLIQGLEFAECLSVVKLADSIEKYPYRNHSYFRMRLDDYYSTWYDPTNHKYVTSYDLDNYFHKGYVSINDDDGNEIDRDYSPIDISMLIRPRCDQTPSTFNVTYIKAEVKGAEDILENPKTGVFLHTFSIFALLGILCI